MYSRGYTCISLVFGINQPWWYNRIKHCTAKNRRLSRYVFNNVIFLIIIYLMTINVGGHYGMNMLRKYIYSYLWSNNIITTKSETKYHLPISTDLFNFDSRSDIIKPNQYIVLSNWKSLLNYCSTLIIVSLILSTLTVANTSRVAKRKQY